MRKYKDSMCVLAALSATLSFIAASNSAHSDVVITVTEVGGDVLFNGVGTLDLFAMTRVDLEDGDLAASSTFVSPFNFGGSIRLGTESALDIYYGGGYTPPSTLFGNKNLLFAGIGSGDMFGPGYELGSLIFTPEEGPVINVPFGYTSGDQLNGSILYKNETIDSLELFPGQYVWSWGSGENADNITLLIVPEPGSFTLMALSGFFFARRRKSSAGGRNRA